MEEIIFASGSVPVAVAARVYGKDASWVRAGIVSGWLPIGKATRSGKLVMRFWRTCISLAAIISSTNGTHSATGLRACLIRS